MATKATENLIESITAISRKRRAQAPKFKILVSFHQLHDAGNFKTFAQLREEFKLPNTDFFRYLQLMDFLLKHTEWIRIVEPTPVGGLLIKIQTRNFDKKLISRCYQIFLDMNLNNTLQIKERWEIEMKANISQDMWEEICTNAHLVTNSNVWREFKWKVIVVCFFSGCC